MEFLIQLLAVVGFVAVLTRAARAAALSVWRGVNAYLAGETAAQHARRGDITAMTDAEKQHAVARHSRWLAGLRLVFWMALIIVPFLTPWTAPIFAAFSVIWLIPGQKVRA